MHSKHEGTNVKCKPNCAPGGTLSKTRLASCSGSTGECWRAAPARYWPDTRQDPPARDTQRDTWRDPLASYSGILSRNLAGSTGEPLWRDTRRDPLASRSGGILSGIHWRAALAGYSAGSTGEQLWQDTRRDPLASCSGGILGGCRSIENADFNIQSNNPFLSGGEKHVRGIFVRNGRDPWS